MMVASSSLINLQHQKGGFVTEPTVPDMAYRMRTLDGQSIDTQSLYGSPNGSFSEVHEPKYSLPTYKEAIEACSNGGRVYVTPSAGDLCYSEMSKESSVSPTDNSFRNIESGHSLYVKHQKHSADQMSPSKLSPPSKRHTSSFSWNDANGNQPDSNSHSSHSPCDNSEYRSLRFSGQDTSEKMQVTDQRYNGNSLNMSKMSNFSVEDRKLYDAPRHVTAMSCSDDDDASRSPPRQASMSSAQNSGWSSKATPSRSSSTSKSLKTSSKSQPSNFFLDDDDDDSWKICSVCGDKATGYHFNALTCEGCKGFFRRSMKNGKSFTCPYNGNCTITKSNRRQCQACRLNKCLRIGMKKECIMSSSEIQMKKNLMMSNRIKRSIIEWKPLDYTPERRELVELIYNSHCQTNNPPDLKEDDDVVTVPRNPTASPASSTSSGFSDLINQMTQDIVATAPGQSNADKAHLRHFSAIMEFSIKEIIKFCKKIPSFISLSLKDQITLLKSGCTEILFIKANYTYDREQNALMCGPGKYYTRESFILGGMSEEYTDCYLQFHHDLSHMRLDDTELACMCAATLFSSDRDELENKEVVERQQEQIVMALQSYTETRYHCRIRFPKIMAYLTRLRTLNWHISKTLQRLQNTEEGEGITPLVLEVVPTV